MIQRNLSFNNSINGQTKGGNEHIENTNTWHDIFKVIVTYVAILLAVIGIFGNSIIVYKFGYLKRKRRSLYETLLLALGLADLICITITPSVFAHGTITNFQSWTAGIVGCKFVLTVLPMNITVTQGLLILISFERYKAIKKPFLVTSASNAKIACYIAMCFLAAVILVSPYAYALDIVNVPKYATRTCTTRGDRTNYVIAFTAVNLVRDIITTLVLVMTGRCISKCLLQNSCSAALQSFRDARRSSLMRVRKMLITLIAVFSLCSLPLDVFQFALFISFEVVKDFSITTYEIIRTVNTSLFLLQASNSAINIFIYAKMHKDFKLMSKRFWRQLACTRKSSLRISNYNYDTNATEIRMISFNRALPKA